MGKLVLFDKQDLVWRNLRPERLTSTGIRIVVFVGGIQCGKTTIGASCTTRAGFYFSRPEFQSEEQSIIIAAPTFPILTQATLPKFLNANRGFGKERKQEKSFKYWHGPTVYMRTATKPESMEGISNVRFIWGDEAGLFPSYFWENIEGRAARLQCPILLTTTPYAMNWLAKLVDDALKGRRKDVLVVQLRSIDSPYFPKSEFERQKGLLDPRRFAMKYGGQFGKMQGLVFPDLNLMRPVQMPLGTRFFGGIDWGHTHPFAITIRALTPNGTHVRLGEYYQVGLTPSQMVDAAKARHSIYHFEAIWCDPSRPDMIAELVKEKLPARPADNRIELGIGKHQDLIHQKKYWIVEEDNPHGIDEYSFYHYPQPGEEGFDDDQKEQLPVDSHNHGIDADRYVTMGILGGAIEEHQKRTPKAPASPGELSSDPRKRIEQLKKGLHRGQN